MSSTDESVRIGLAYQAFDQHFGRGGSTRMVRVPGRVNLIGDHTDYNGLPVFPMAIQKNTMLLLRPRDDPTVRFVNVDNRFPPRSFTLHTPIEPHPSGDWANYPKAAAQTLLDHHRELTGFDAVVAGSIPVAAGLSSSSSLVVATALGLAAVNGLDLDDHELMLQLALGERYVGTEGGGMDQAIVLGGVEGHAVRIDFDPLCLTPVWVPAQWRFVVASSMVPAEKSGRAQTTYNRRVVECAAALTAMFAHFEIADAPSYRALLQHHPADALLSQAPFALDEPHLSRFRHVVTESRRVDRAGAAMRDEDLAAFGRLMTESHVSLRNDYEVTCPELDELVDYASDHGAAGARMTGAGMGGCVVAVCHADRVDAVLDGLAARFFRHREYDGPLSDHLFVAEPAAGAAVSDA